MHNSSLLEILKTFSPEELKTFEDFVSSPYFNKKSFVTGLYKHIKKYSPEFESPRLNREKVWKALYPEKEYNYGIFKNLLFDLTKLAEKFLSIENFENGNFLESYTLLSSFIERKLKRAFKLKYNTIMKEMKNLNKKKKISIEDYFYFMSKFRLLKFGFSIELEKHPEMGKELEEHSLFLISYFFTQLIRTNINLLGFNREYNYKDYEIEIETFFKAIDSQKIISNTIDSLKSKSIESYNVLSLHYKMYKSISDDKSLEKYFDFKKAVDLFGKDFSKEDKFVFYQYLRNSLSQLINPGLNKSKELLDITKLLIREDLILDKDGLLKITVFVSTIQTACNLNDTDFIEDFTKKFSNYLPEDSKENMLTFSRAHLYFSQNNFEKSLEKILTIDYDLFVMKYYLKNLQMMNYYELSDYDGFILSADSFKHFLSKNKSVSESWKKLQNMFCIFLNRLFKLEMKFDEFEFQNLKKEIISSNANKKSWLLQKINEMENRKTVRNH